MGSGPVTDTGVVEEVSGEALVVVIAGSAACAGCGICERAGGGKMRVVVRRPDGVEPGAEVRLTFPYSSVWTPILYVFVLPLVLLGAFAGLAALAAKLAGAGRTASGLIVAGAAVAGLVVAALVGRGRERRFRRRVFEETRVEPVGTQGG